MSRVLIVSSGRDWSARQVAHHLQARGSAYSWLDPAEFPRRVRLTARLDQGWYGEVETPDGIFCWEEIAAVKSLAEPIITESGSQKAIWTRRVMAAELTDLAGLEVTAHLFQGLPIAEAIADELTGDGQ